MTLDDWALAKTMYATSRAVMDDLVEYGREKAQDKADASADAHATREARGYLAKKNADSNVARIALLIYKHAQDGPVVDSGRTPENYGRTRQATVLRRSGLRRGSGVAHH